MAEANSGYDSRVTTSAQKIERPAWLGDEVIRGRHLGEVAMAKR